jgi:hypothetical protein
MANGLFANRTLTPISPGKNSLICKKLNLTKPFSLVQFWLLIQIPQPVVRMLHLTNPWAQGLLAILSIVQPASPGAGRTPDT